MSEKRSDSGQRPSGDRRGGRPQGGSKSSGDARRGQSRSRSQPGRRGGSGGRGKGSRDSGYRQGSGSSKDRREEQHRGRHGRDSQARSGQRRAFSVDGGSQNLPKWLKEEIQRVTPKDRQDATIELLSEAASDFAAEQFRQAHRKLLKAKNLSSRASAIRELLGLTAYRLGNWEESLRELRAFRRFTGDTTHMPIEMDSLRGLKRSHDVEKTWDLFMELGGHPATDAELRVVYGSFLLDQNRAKDAWEITKPRRVTKESKAFERRRWFVAARAAVALGDAETAHKLVDAVRAGDPDLPGLDDVSDAVAHLKADQNR